MPPELVYEIFPGTPEVRNGYMYPNQQPGLGIDVNEELAAAESKTLDKSNQSPTKGHALNYSQGSINGLIPGNNKTNLSITSSYKISPEA